MTVPAPQTGSKRSRMRVIAFCCMTLPAFGQSSAPLPLTLRQAVDLALSPSGDARLRLAEEILAQSEARVRQARAALLPNVDATVTGQNFTRNLRAFGVRSPLPSVPFPEVVGPITFVDGRATLTQSVFDFASIRRLQAARAGTDLAQAEQEAARNQVTSQVARVYAAAQRAAAQVEVAEANTALAEALASLARNQKIAGTGTGIEVTRAEVQLANERQRLLVARNGLERALLQLRRAVGLDLATPIRLADPLAPAPAHAVDVEEAIRTAHARRADWKAQQSRETAARAALAATRAERLPSIGAFADAGQIGLELGDTRFTRVLGAQLRVPLWDGGRRDARRAESAIELRREEIRSRDFSRQVELEVRLALEDVRSADSQVLVAAEGLALAEAELAAARRRYEAGVTTSVEVTEAQARLTRARDNRTAAIYLQRLAQIELASAMGVINQVIQ